MSATGHFTAVRTRGTRWAEGWVGSVAVSNSLRYRRHCKLTGAGTKGTVQPTPIFTKLQNAKQHYVQSSYAKFHPNSDKKWVKYGYNSMYFPLWSVTFTGPSQSLNKPHSLNIFKICSAPNVIQIGQKMQKIRESFNLRPWIKMVGTARIFAKRTIHQRQSAIPNFTKIHQ